MYVSFYEINPDALPEDANYYHNVFVTTYGMTKEMWEELGLDEDTESICYTDQLTAPFPRMDLFYYMEEQEEEEIIEYPHSIVEITQEGQITWYDGQGDPDSNPWKF